MNYGQVFPMVLPPDRDDGLGVILLNSNADTHFSFHQRSADDLGGAGEGIEVAAAQYPRAWWIGGGAVHSIISRHTTFLN
jgi:hypothetical protein